MQWVCQLVDWAHEMHLYLFSLPALGPASTSNATGGVDVCGGGDLGVIGGGAWCNRCCRLLGGGEVLDDRLRLDM